MSSVPKGGKVRNIKFRGKVDTEKFSDELLGKDTYFEIIRRGLVRGGWVTGPLMKFEEPNLS